MYSPWILGVGLALVVLVVIRRWFSGRSQKRDSIFRTQLRTGEGTTATSTATRASEVIAESSSREERIDHQHADLGAAPVLAGTASSRSELQYQSTTTAHAGGRDGSVNRISTWQNRKLFSDFRGIVDDDVHGLVTPIPEELPIRNEDLVFGAVTPSIAQLLPESAARREIQRKLLLGAGYRSRASWINLTAIRFVLAFFSLVSVGFWLLMAPPQFEVMLVGMAVVGPLLMWALPPLIVGMKANERKIDIERGLPDVLDMLNMGVSQGLSVPQCFRRIAVELKEAHPELADELRFVTQQAEIGTMSQALKNFSQRIDSPEVSSFTSLLIQSESTGSSISRALTDYSDSIRSSLKERADSRANAASFKLLFPVALCLMPSVFLFLLGPAIVQLSDFLSTGAEALNNDRQNAMDSLQQQPRLDLSRFNQNGF